ncbi:MAG TPA: histidine phosphatase family protein [Ktedonobacteraceae bacterium]|nr:histidine phosphatase family protein [Ktedonobacteraceae bacterium]
MPTILLIRHGESQSNAGLPTSSPEVVKLTDKGWQQAKDIAQFLKESQFQPELIVTSSYLRTKQTAARTMSTFPLVPEKEWPVQEFTYLSMWHQENSTKDDRRQMVDAYWKLSDPHYVDDPKSGTPKSESFAQFIARVREVKEQLEQIELDTIAIFTHEQFITAFQWLSLPESQQINSKTMRKFRAFLKANPIPNGAVVQAKYNREYDEWRYELFREHLGRIVPEPEPLPMQFLRKSLALVL